MKSKKSKLQSEADRLWFIVLFAPICEVCSGKATQVHHFFPKGNYGHLRYNLKNGIPICKLCHFKHHTKFSPEIHQAIIKKRGQDWYDDLEAEARKRLSSFKTIGYYEDIISKLKELEP